MKIFTIITIIALLVVSFMSISVFAQELNSGIANNALTNKEVNSEVTNKVVISPITNKELNSDKSTKKLKSGGPEFYDYMKTDKITPKIKSAIYDLRVEPSKIFSPVISSVENLVVVPIIKDKKVVYELKAKDVNKPIFNNKQVVQPIFDLQVDEPVEFKLVDNKIIVNDEQIIDYKEVVREKEVMPPIELEIKSTITNSKVYDLKILSSHESAEFNFIYREKEVIMPIYLDFKVENKKLYLLKNDKPYYLRINPPEIYSTVYDLTVKEPKIVIKELSFGIENEKAVYDLRVEQPAKILGIIPWTVESKYLIDSTDGNIKLVNSHWYITYEKLSYEWDFDNDVPE